MTVTLAGSTEDGVCEDLAETMDNPEWTAEDFPRAKPLAESFLGSPKALKNDVTIVRSPGSLRLSVPMGGDLAAYNHSFGDKAEARLAADIREVRWLATEAG